MKSKVFLLFLIFSSIASFVFVNVRAARGYDKVYYVTDNPNYQSTLSYLRSNSSYYYNDFVVIYYNNSMYDSLYFVEDVYNGDTYFDYQSIYDSSVIFECNYEFSVRNYNENHSNVLNYSSVSFSYFSFMLTTIFSTLKTQGRNNDICFICATDQNRFSSKLFLNYVDFHIDTDTYYLFMRNVVDYCENNYNMPISGLSFLINNGMFNPISQNSFADTYIYSEYFKPYLYYHYGSGCYSDNDLLDNAARNYGVHFYFNYYNLEYKEYDYFYNGYFDIIDLDDDELPPGDFVFLGQSFGTTTDSEYYLDEIIDYETAYGIDVPFFYYDSNNQNIDAYVENEDVENFYPGYTATVAIPTINTLLLDFIEGNDITTHDNWSGVCDITHKMINFGPDGWMINVGYREEFDIDFVVSF